MPVVVVDFLEIVQIEEEDADRFIFVATEDAGADFLVNRISVRQACKRISIRQFYQPPLRKTFLVTSVPQQIKKRPSLPSLLFISLFRNRKRRSPYFVLMAISISSGAS